jgi:hypothetical protein
MSLTLTENKKDDRQAGVAWIRSSLGPRSIVLIGLMGAGKTAVGKRLASRLELPFVDADSEIEAAAGATISEIFAEHGEAYFRQGERKVIARLSTAAAGARHRRPFMDADAGQYQARSVSVG